MINVYIPPDWVIARVTELKPEGDHGPFGFAEAIKSSRNWIDKGDSISFSYRDPQITGPPSPASGGDLAWNCSKVPRPGQIIVLGDIDPHTEGWRAGFATRYWKPYHEHPDIRLTNEERTNLKRNNGNPKSGRP